MANVIINDQHLKDVANAIRAKKGTFNQMLPSEMASEINGISTGIDTSDATASSNDILSGKTAYTKGTKITGNIQNHGQYIMDIYRISQVINIPQGYHNGTGYVSISQADARKLIPENIREGITILGVTGTMKGMGTAPQADGTLSFIQTSKYSLLEFDAFYDYPDFRIVREGTDKLKFSWNAISNAEVYELHIEGIGFVDTTKTSMLIKLSDLPNGSGNYVGNMRIIANNKRGSYGPRLTLTW